MKKKVKKNIRLLLVSLIFILIFIILILNLFLVSADDKDKVRRTYNWVRSQAVGKWGSLDTEEHVFSFLVLKDKLTSREKNLSYTSLIDKSYDNGTCWPSSCNGYETALARLALISLEKDYKKADSWIASKSSPIILQNMQWYLQVIQDRQMICALEYDISHEFTIKEDGTILGDRNNFGNCFYKSDNGYFLVLENNEDCLKKAYNLTCNESFSLNFMFKKGSEWHATGKFFQSASSGTIYFTTFNLTSNCIKPGSVCDYKSTLWTAFSFYLSGEQDKAKEFLPYLIMEEDSPENQQYFPSSILYKITSTEEYGKKVNSSQGIDWLFSIPGGECKYYNSALARLDREKINLTELDKKLFSDLVKDGSYYHWNCNPEHNLRDTAMLLWSGFGSEYLEDPPCIREGYRCVENCTDIGGESVFSDCRNDNLECCNVSLSSYSCEQNRGVCKPSCNENETQTDYFCSPGQCCKLYNESLCAREIHGILCYGDALRDAVCLSNNVIIPFIYSGDSGNNKCCKGTCDLKNKSCLDMQGDLCETGLGESCASENILPSSEGICCKVPCTTTPMTCLQKGGRVCLIGEDCKDGYMVDASDTGGQLTCCIQGGTCIQSICEENLCLTGQICSSGRSYDTIEGLCCEGTCVDELSKCNDIGGQECVRGKKCSTSTVESSDIEKCCMGTCVESKFPWLIVVIIFILILGVLAFFFAKKKFPKKEKTEKTDEFGLDNEIFAKSFAPAPSKTSSQKTFLKIPKAEKTILKKEEKQVSKKQTKKPEKKKPAEESEEDTFNELEKISE